MKEIGILTFHNAHNYGAVLQAYALKKMVSKIIGEENCDIINYRNACFEKSFLTIFKRSNLKLKLFFPYLIYLELVQRRNFKKFINKYLSLDKRTFYKHNINDLGHEYKNIIVGSDQVWNPKCNGNDDTYLLNFPFNGGKYSYAASFGISKIKSEYIELYKRSLNNFDYLSVREFMGAEIVKNLIGKSVPVVLDPTLLLDKTEWEEFVLRNRSSEKKYILLYMLSYSPFLVQSAINLSKKTGQSVISIGKPSLLKRVKGIEKREKGIDYRRSVTPIDWLKLFLNADFVFTNSFHGLAFSINFAKSFYVKLCENDMGLNSRINALLEQVHLKNRIMPDGSIKEVEYINYSNIENLLSEKRKNSIEVLKKICSSKN